MARMIILFALLPYFRASPMDSDVQPYFLLALAAYLVLFAIQHRHFPVHWGSMLVGAYLGSIYFVLGGGVQSIALFFLPVSVEFFSRRTKADIMWGLKAATLILLGGVLLQLLYSPLLADLLANYRVSLQRGFTSFTSEPSYLGILGYFLCVTFLLLEAGYRWVLAAIILVVLSASATALAPLVVVLAVYFLRGWRLLLLPVGAVVIIYAAGFAAQTDTRIGALLRTALDSPALLLLDVSVSNRITRAFGPLYAAASDYFMPHMIFEQLDINFGFTAAEADSSISRLSNVAGVLAYSFGILSLPVLWVYFRLARAPLYYWVALFFLVLVNLSVATPYVFLALAMPIWLGKVARSKDAGGKTGKEPSRVWDSELAKWGG